MLPLLGTRKPAQVAIIVHDVEEAKKKYAAFWGVEVPPTVDAGAYEMTKTEYYGVPNEEAGCLMAFFDLEALQFEIIQPNKAQSTWRDFLEKHGEGLHHMAFIVDDLFKSMEDMKKAGYELTQWGNYSDGSGGYAYFDATRDLKCFIELLSTYKK
jgi:catechol 2,3-dioxygenase-like lactoylglutathione lyase family enzyme